MNQELQKEIIVCANEKQDYINRHGVRVSKMWKGKKEFYGTYCLLKENFIQQRTTISKDRKTKYRWYKYNFKYLKKYNKECATNLGLGTENLLSKNDLLTWCEMNNIKCAKSTKYKDIVKKIVDI